MSLFKSMFTTAMVLGAFLTMVSTAVYASSWDRMNESELYGLSHVTEVHKVQMNKGFEKLDYGPDAYGLPHIAGGHDITMSFQKADFGEDLYGLPYAGTFHKK
ncbi:MAG: hypothetical protein OEY50_06600 [Nitrospinota bacterium]|nr:hypothetical protein [Nitrospinota bacterium]MDH5677608.1 hypothetical protein [Nitrospinota bacterium]MDH5756526.1 hypothetical protein [Nitrospinota bacterium]